MQQIQNHDLHIPSFIGMLLQTLNLKLPQLKNL